MILAHNQHHKPFLGLDNNNNYKNFLLHKSEMHSIPLISNKEDYRLKKVSILNTLNTLYKITLWNKFLKFAKPFSIHFFSVLAIYSVSEKNEAIFSSWLTFATCIWNLEYFWFTLQDYSLKLVSTSCKTILNSFIFSFSYIQPQKRIKLFSPLG